MKNSIDFSVSTKFNKCVVLHECHQNYSHHQMPDFSFKIHQIQFWQTPLGSSERSPSWIWEGKRKWRREWRGRKEERRRWKRKGGDGVGMMIRGHYGDGRPCTMERNVMVVARSGSDEHAVPSSAATMAQAYTYEIPRRLDIF